MPRTHLRPLGVALLLAAAGCGDAARAAAGPPPPGSAPSLDELGRRAVEAFVRADTAGADRLRVSEAEYATAIHPVLARESEGGAMPLDIALRGFAMRNGRASRRYLQRMQGLPLAAGETRCDGERTEYAEFTLLRGCVTVVRDTTAGRSQAMPLFAQVVVQGGGYRALRFDD